LKKLTFFKKYGLDLALTAVEELRVARRYRNIIVNMLQIIISGNAINNALNSIVQVEQAPVAIAA